jgi:hypothetical protein
VKYYISLSFREAIIKLVLSNERKQNSCETHAPRLRKVYVLARKSAENEKNYLRAFACDRLYANRRLKADLSVVSKSAVPSSSQALRLRFPLRGF